MTAHRKQFATAVALRALGVEESSAVLPRRLDALDAGRARLLLGNMLQQHNGLQILLLGVPNRVDGMLPMVGGSSCGNLGVVVFVARCDSRWVSPRIATATVDSPDHFHFLRTTRTHSASWCLVSRLCARALLVSCWDLLFTLVLQGGFRA